uniref:4-oxalocrotonate decarboxylase n=1 Tax=Geobacillus stearothermophilus TaxID=1422 RepID=B0VXM8_GEOSE|nr:4-oxalocrotonate decarboxylase [Geobacillus stearothermophilus]
MALTVKVSLYRKFAELLNEAEREKREVARITEEVPDLSAEEAYKIQEELIKIKTNSGHRIIGPKMGLTSQAKMAQMKVKEPIYGYLFDYMFVPSGGAIHMSELIHPKVEVEIAFILGEDLEGPHVTSTQVLSATKYVAPALEIIDSRYQDFTFTLPDVIADNASSSRVVIGNTMTPIHSLKTDLDLIGAALYINGELKACGAGAAVFNHPANSVAVLANMLARKGERLKAGDIILTGGITEAIQLSAGDTVIGQLDQLGDVSLSVKE